jgi:hypothetical protein
MSGITKEWIVFASFFILLIVAVIGEIMWLVRSGWTMSGTAVGFVLVTDVICAVIGTVLGTVIATLMFMIVMGPAGKGSDGGEPWLVAGTVGLALLPALLLFFVKRGFLALFKIRGGKQAWSFSAAATLMTLILALVPPGLLAYFL